MAGTTSKLAPFKTRLTHGSIGSRSASASARRCVRGWGGAVLVVGLLAMGLLAMGSVASSAQDVSVPLGEAANFAALAGSTVTNTGPSVISGGHVGVSPGSAVTGFGPGTVTPPSTIHRADSIALQAKNDLTTAYNNVAGRAPGERIFADLAGRTLEPGVYTATSSLALNGDLTLDAKGDPNAEFIFQAGSTLLVGTTSVSAVRLINGAQASNVFWQVGSSATIGVNSALVGNILALTSITMQTNTGLKGRALARNGAVTLETTTITTPAPETAAPSEAPTPNVDPVISGLSDVASAVSLAEPQLQAAKEIVATDPRLQAALGGADYTIEKSGPWTTRGSDSVPQRLIGAAFVLRLSRPVSLEDVKLPAALYDSSERRNPPYQRVLNTVSAESVTELDARVDLGSASVVSIKPNSLSSTGVTIRPPEGFVREVPLPEEGR